MIGFPRPLSLSERLRLSFRTGKGRMGAMLKRGKLTQSFADCVPLFIALGDSTRLTIIQHLYEALPDGGSCPAQPTECKGDNGTDKSVPARYFPSFKGS